MRVVCGSGGRCHGPSRELPECCADTQPELSLSGDSAIAACYFCSSVFQSCNEDSALIMTF